MKKYKLIFLTIILVILTGCTARYDVTIKSNGKVEEKIVIYFDSQNVDSNNVDLLIKDTLKTYRENGMYVNYKVTKDVNKGKSSITATRTYKSMSDYVNSSELLPILFEKTLYIDDYGIKGLQTTGEYYYDALFDTDIADEPQFESIDVNIQSHFGIVETNALKTDEDNIMHWLLNQENKKNSISFKYNNSKRYDIIIKEYLKKNWFSMIVVLAIIVSVLMIVAYIKNQDRQNNKI